MRFLCFNPVTQVVDCEEAWYFSKDTSFILDLEHKSTNLILVSNSFNSLFEKCDSVINLRRGGDVSVGNRQTSQFLVQVFAHRLQKFFVSVFQPG